MHLVRPSFVFLHILTKIAGSVHTTTIWIVLSPLKTKLGAFDRPRLRSENLTAYPTRYQVLFATRNNTAALLRVHGCVETRQVYGIRYPAKADARFCRFVISLNIHFPKCTTCTDKSVQNDGMEYSRNIYVGGGRMIYSQYRWVCLSLSLNCVS